MTTFQAGEVIQHRISKARGVIIKYLASVDLYEIAWLDSRVETFEQAYDLEQVPLPEDMWPEDKPQWAELLLSALAMAGGAGALILFGFVLARMAR